MKKVMNNQGFTLVELMIVIVIVGILAAVAIPKFNVAADKAKASEFPTVLTAIYTNQETYKAEQGVYYDGATWDDISMEEPTSKWFTYSWTTAGDKMSYQADAVVEHPFGKAEKGKKGWLTSGGAKDADPELLRYVPNWKVAVAAPAP